MTDAAKIARGLTGAERGALKRHPIIGHYGSTETGWGLSAHDEYSFAKAGRRLMDLRLIDWHPNKRDSRTHLTSLGLAVCAELERNSHE